MPRATPAPAATAVPVASKQPVGSPSGAIATEPRSNPPEPSVGEPSNQVQPPAATHSKETADRQPLSDEKGTESPQVQAQMMHDQLTAPTRIPQDAKKPATVDEPPPASLNVAGLGGLNGAATNTIFDRRGQPIVTPGPSKPLVISSGLAVGMLLQKTVPVYPPIAKTNRVSGAVELRAVISRTGTIRDLRVVSGPLILRQAALEAVRTWRYKPYKLNNQPVEVETIVEVIFAAGE